VSPIVGMNTEPANITVRFGDPSIASGARPNRAQSDRLCRAIKGSATSLKGERAALVLVFGGATDVVAGQNVARAIAGQLGCANKPVFGKKVATRAFWDGSLPLGQARLEVFLFATRDKA
jgi:hypothetical protein